MAEKVTKSKRPAKISKPAQQQTLSIIPGGKINNFLNNFSDKIINFRRQKSFYLILLVIGILLLAFYKKSWFVAALVNDMPITNLELQSKLNEQFRSQTLNQLINEKIIMNEASKKAAIPNEEDVNKKIAELESSVGGKEVLDSLLSQQGQTRTSLRDQVRVQLAIAKLYENEASVSASEVEKFLAENRESLKATDSAQQEKQAFDAIKNQKLSQIFSQKFQNLRQKAKIQIF